MKLMRHYPKQIISDWYIMSSSTRTIMKYTIVFMIIYLVQACYKRPMKQVILASDLYFIEFDQILNRTGLWVETEKGMEEWRPWIRIRPLTSIRIAAAQIAPHALFSHTFTETSAWAQNFGLYNVSSKIVGESQ